VNSEEVIGVLRTHAPELKKAGLAHLHLFGSVARGHATRNSDVDLMAEFDASSRMTLIKLGGLQHRLSSLLGVPVDLSSADWMREPVRQSALQEALLVF
jgi:predicted nucleotidyltransferase